MLYVAILYVSIRPVVMRVKEELQFYLMIGYSLLLLLLLLC